MAKKKRQSEPSGDIENDSSESCDENQNKSLRDKGCSHASKAVDLTRIKRLIKPGLHTECPHCLSEAQEKRNGETSMEEDFEYDLTLWLCLKCGNQGCGRSKNQHALKHFNTPHSDSHALCVNTTIWTVWCYDCDNEVNPNAHKKLLDAVEYIKKQTVVDESHVNNKPKIDNSLIELLPITNNVETVTDVAPLPRVRGLSNLGNTCFFNAVMQCLAQTPFLVQLLEETRASGEHFHLPGGKLYAEDKDSKILEPLDGVLEGWRPMTQILAETLQEIKSGRPDTYNPRMLFDRLKVRMPQFAGGDQHDSHELLRHLLEAVREEDLRRYQSVILEKLGLKTSTNPASVEGDRKKIIRFYGQQASDLLLRTEQAFRGVLVSTLQCQDCDHLSHRDEVFLDLSLPIAEKQMLPPSRRKAEDDVDNKPSKHMIKKQKQAARKGRKNKVAKKMDASGEGPISEENSAVGASAATAVGSESESDADVEDNTEDTASSNPNNEEQPKGTESGYNSDKIGDTSPDLNTNGSPDDSGVPSPTTSHSTAIILPPPMHKGSPASSESNIEILPINGPMEDETLDEPEEADDRPVSRLAFNTANTSNLDNKLAELTLSWPSEVPPTDEKSAQNQADRYARTSGILGSRYQCEEGECSVQSCLNQFTARELMTANNKVGCARCTKRHGGADKKTVYTNASKQLLVKSPPPVLILHLKRFQVFRYIRKMSKHVSFPLVLDLAPFCSDRYYENASYSGQKRLLYSLYGVVEHSGHLHGGHYVAYVKVRAPLSEDSYRWQFLPRNQKGRADDTVAAQEEDAGNMMDNSVEDEEVDLEEEEDGARGQDTPDVPPGQWYYVSDSHVSEIPESKVLKAQAYLLFYERIL